MNERGVLITAAGLDFSGKDTFIDAIAEHLRQQGKKVLDIRKFTEAPELGEVLEQDWVISCEPTYFEIGRFIREEVIADNGTYYTARDTAEHFSGDRFVLLDGVIIPSRNKGVNHLKGRGKISSDTYQPLQARRFEGTELTLEEINAMAGNLLAGQCVPDLMQISRCPPAECMKRKASRTKQDNCQYETLEFLEELHKRYEMDEILDFYKSRGTKVHYINTGISLEVSKASAIGSFEWFMAAKKYKRPVRDVPHLFGD